MGPGLRSSGLFFAAKHGESNWLRVLEAMFGHCPKCPCFPTEYKDYIGIR